MSKETWEQIPKKDRRMRGIFLAGAIFCNRKAIVEAPGGADAAEGTG